MGKDLKYRELYIETNLHLSNNEGLRRAILW